MQPQQQYNAPVQQHNRPAYGVPYDAQRRPDVYAQQPYAQQQQPQQQQYNTANYNSGYYYPYQGNAPMYNVPPPQQGYDAMGFSAMGRGGGRGRGAFGRGRGAPNAFYGPRGGAGFPGGRGWGGGFYRRRKKPFVGGSLETQREYEHKTACCFFLQGKCKFGSHCRFIHDEAMADMVCQFGDDCRVHGSQNGQKFDASNPNQDAHSGDNIKDISNQEDQKTTREETLVSQEKQ